MRFFTAANLVQKLKQAQQQLSLERFQKQLDKVDLLICNELVYLSSNRSGAELLFQAFADRQQQGCMIHSIQFPRSESLFLRGELFATSRPTRQNLLDAVHLGSVSVSQSCESG